MSIIILELSAETERTLRVKATQAGQTLEAYLGVIAEREATNGAAAAPHKRTFDEILAPARDGFAQSGAGEDELVRLFEEAREEVFQHKRGPQGEP